MSAVLSSSALGAEAGLGPDATWPMPRVDGVRHATVSVAGARIHYAESGSGAPLVLLHGWPQHWWSYRAVIGPLARTFRVICPDVRGLGWSGSSPRGHHLIELAADVVGLLDELELKSAFLVGHDWGAAIGYTACVQWPRRFEKFIALGAVTPWSAEGALGRLCRQAWHVAALAIAGRFGPRTGWLPRHALCAWRHAGRFTAEEQRTYLGPLGRRDAERATARFYRSLVFREIPYFARNYATVRLRTPTLHLNGAHDPLTRGVPHNYVRYADTMRLDVLPDCGHFIPEEQPEHFVERLVSFIG